MHRRNDTLIVEALMHIINNNVRALELDLQTNSRTQPWSTV